MVPNNSLLNDLVINFYKDIDAVLVTIEKGEE